MTHYLDNQIKILRGPEAETWKASRKRVEVDHVKKDRLDGITLPFHILGSWTATALSNYDEPI